MKRSGHWILLALFLPLLLVTPGMAQQMDMLLKGGHVMDPKNGIDEVMDVGITDGIISHVASNLSESNAEQVIDVSGHLVTPGIIDLHGHLSPIADPPDGFTFRAGVTTMIDAGTFGWRNLALAKEQVDAAETRVLLILSITGNKGSDEGDHSSSLLVQDYTDYNPEMTAAQILDNEDLIVGIKVWKSPDFTGIERAVEAGELADVPVMIDFGGNDPPLSLSKLLLETFRPGDIYTHAYAYHPWSRESIVDENYRIKSYVQEARDRGIIFDVGHGGGAFSFEAAVPAMEQGFYPDVISTDLHLNSMNDGAKEMANMMSKFLAMGMPLTEVIEASTWKPAQVIQREEFGHLTVGAPADVAVFNVREGDFGFLDVRNIRYPGDRLLEAELTLLEGRVMWDRNGMAGQAFEHPAQ
ncbi:MAG: amidohydrolase/deacetylase family metallohydrolase [Balneolaceae bacterium]